VIVRSIIVLLSDCPMYNTQRQQGVIRHKITNTGEKHTQSLRIKRLDRYALTDDDRLKIIEQEQKEFNDRIDKLDIRPKPIKCTCLSTHGSDMWTTSIPTDEQVVCREPNYNVKMHVFKHFYNCILGSYIIQDCCDIVYDYVGVIHTHTNFNILYWHPESKSKIWTHIPTLGSTFIDHYGEIFISRSTTFYENGEDVHDGTCIAFECEIKSYKGYLCQEHYDQWQELPITLIHNHKCRECRHIGKCRGHKVPRKYKCKKCDQKR
jgi:hypothetical protein